MNRRLSILFIFMLLFQTVSGSIVLPAQTLAEGNDDIIEGISLLNKEGEQVKIEDLESGEEVGIQVNWLNPGTEAEVDRSDTRSIPEGVLIKGDQAGELLTDDPEVGSYEANTDGIVTVTIAENEEESEEASGSFIIEGEIETKEPVNGDEPEEDLVTTKPERSVESKVDKKDEPKVANEKATDLAENEPKEITENIIDEIKLLKKDGTPYEDDELIELTDELRFDLDWSLPNGHEYKSGDYFEFQLPKQLQIYNQLSGSLGDYGSYTVDLNGNATFTFNEIIEDESDVEGTFWYETKLVEQEVTSIEETIEVIQDGKVIEEINVNLKPKGGQAIHKEGQPVGGNFNTEVIEWAIVVNTTRDSLENAIINDPILSGQELDLDSLVLKEVEVDLTGKVTKVLDEVAFTDNSTTEKLNIELGDTNKAYQLTFKTNLLESDFIEGTTNYPNTVTLTSNGKADAEHGASVSVSRPKSLEKTSSTFKKEDRSIEWTVNANFTEQQLKQGDELTDEFTFTVGKEAIDGVFEIKEDNIQIEQVDSFKANGEADQTSDAKSLFDITIDGNKVTYKLKDASNKAFVLKYKTEVKEGAYINHDGEITNKIDLNGKTAQESQGVYQQVGKKENSGINYEDKTIDWTITVNADKQDLKNFVLTDDFSGTGQKLVEDSIEITPTSAATIKENADLEGFEVDFGNIKEQYTITYQTKFTYDFEDGETPNFKNGVNITYKTSEEGPDYELEFGNEVKPNEKTKNNGAKNVSRDDTTKELIWKVDINYNNLSLTNARVTDEIEDNQSLIDGSVKIYETSIDDKGNITVGDDVTDQFTVDAKENQVNVDFGTIDKSYRIEFKTKDKDDIYNSDEVYYNEAKFYPSDDESKHKLTAQTTFPDRGKFVNKTGNHNKEDWTVDWKVAVNESKSTLNNVKITDDLGDSAAQILLTDTIKVTKVGSNVELEEGTDYELSVNGNKLEVFFPDEIADTYEITYSSYILTEETSGITNDVKMTTNEEVTGTTEKTETVQVVIGSGGGTGVGATGGLELQKTEKGSERALPEIEFKLIKKIGNQEIIVREGVTKNDGTLRWDGLKYGQYTLIEKVPEGYLGGNVQGEIEQEITISSENVVEGIKTKGIENQRKTGKAKIIKVDSVTDETLSGAKFIIENQTTGQKYTLITEVGGVIEKEVPFGEYTVKEITAPEGYRITEDIPNITVEIDKTATIEVKNVAIVDVVGQKTWFVDENKELPENITVKLLADGIEIDSQEVKKSNNWEYSFKNLDKYNTVNREIKYEIEEVEIDGYVVERDGFDLTNIQTTNVSGTKTWVDDNNPDRPDKITVQLLANDKKLDDKTVDVTEATGWKYSFNDLPKYDMEGKEITYAIDEVKVDGYKANIDDFDITNTRANTISVKGEKIWKDEDPTDRPDEIKVDLTREVKGEIDKDFTQTQTVKPNDKGNWIYEFSELDEFDENGVAYTYTIKEGNVPDNYVSTVDGYDITNVRVGKTEVSGTKRWKDDKVADRPESIKVNLLRNNVVVDTIEKVTAEDNWKYSFTDLDKYDEDGKYYEYKVSEEQVPGYAPKVTGDDITNTRSEKTNIEITKGWLDDDSKDRPDSIIVYLYQNEQLFDTINVEADKDWVYKLTDLEAYDKDGQPYTYEVKEKPIDGYKSTVEGFNITNLRVGETEVAGKKTWLDNDDATGDRPESITVHLLQNEKPFKTTETDASKDWEYSFENLPEFDEEGVKYVYTINEELDEATAENYEKSIDEHDLTNLRIGTTEVTGEKTWLDNDDATGDRPASITVNLLQNEKPFKTTETDATKDWEYSFENLPEFDAEGVKYVYTIDEELDEATAENYEKSIDEHDLTNLRIGTTEVTGEKTWLDNDDATGDRPASITVHLLQNKEPFKTTETDATKDWEYSFENLPEFDAEGVKYVYTIDEELDEATAENYEKSIDKHDLTNLRIGTIEVAGKKTWLDNDDATGDRPASITVHLLQNKEPFKTTETDATKDWNYSFKDLPEFDAEGVKYVYTIDEELDEATAENYEKSIDKYDLTNLRVGETEVTVDKTWKDESTTDRPDSIKVNLLQNGTPFKTDVEIKPDDAGNWSHAFENLPKFDKEGKAYEYTVTEHDVPGYASEVDGFEITNTRAEVKTIEITKSWLDNDSKDRPDSIEVELFRSIAEGEKESVNVYEVTAADGWSLEITDLPAYDADGNAYTYEINEKDVAGYESKVNGFDITNLRVGTLSVDGTKTWVGDAASDRPSSIVVDLMKNGEKIEEKEVTAKTDWKYSFTDLPAFDENGVAYEYTVAEQEVAGYTSKVDGYDITNTLIPVTPESEDSDEPNGSDDSDEMDESGEGVPVPSTATNIFNLMLIGFGLIVLGLVSFFIRRRKTA